MMPGRAGCFLLAAGLFVLICGAGCRAADAPAARVNDVQMCIRDSRYLPSGLGSAPARGAV